MIHLSLTLMLVHSCKSFDLPFSPQEIRSSPSGSKLALSMKDKIYVLDVNSFLQTQHTYQSSTTNGNLISIDNNGHLHTYPENSGIKVFSCSDRLAIFSDSKNVTVIGNRIHYIPFKHLFSGFFEDKASLKVYSIHKNKLIVESINDQGSFHLEGEYSLSTPASGQSFGDRMRPIVLANDDLIILGRHSDTVDNSMLLNLDTMRFEKFDNSNHALRVFSISRWKNRTWTYHNYIIPSKWIEGWQETYFQRASFIRQQNKLAIIFGSKLVFVPTE